MSALSPEVAARYLVPEWQIAYYRVEIARHYSLARRSAMQARVLRAAAAVADRAVAWMLLDEAKRAVRAIGTQWGTARYFRHKLAQAEENNRLCRAASEAAKHACPTCGRPLP